MERGVWISKKAELRYETVKDFINGKLARKDAAASLGIKERALTDLANKVRRLGLTGAVHGNQGRVGSRRFQRGSA